MEHNECPTVPCEMVKRLQAVLYGNGSEGLMMRLVRIEERLDSIGRELERSHEETLRRMETRLRWAIALIPSFIYFLMNFLLKFFETNR